jgi:hypothetical protein
MMEEMNVLAVGFYFRMHLRNSIRNMQLRNSDVLTVSLEVCSEISVQVGDMIYLLTAVWLPPSGSSTIHIYTQTIHRTTLKKQYIEQQKNLEECGPRPVFVGYTLAFALQPRKKHEKPQSG